MPLNDKWEWKLQVKGGPGSGNFGHSGRPGQVGGSGSGGSGGGSADYSGPVEFGKPKIERSRYGQTKGQQLSREIEVQRRHSSGLMGAILYIRQRGKDSPFRLFGLSGNQIGGDHNSLGLAKREAARIAESVDTEDQLP